MKILHVVPTYLPAFRYGGTIQSVHGLCKALTELGHEVEVVTTSVDGPRDSKVLYGEPVMVDGVCVRYFKSPWLRRLYWSPEIKKFLNKNADRFDIFHLHSIFLWPTWAAARIARRKNIPYVISPRGMLVQDMFKNKNFWIKTAWLEAIERRNLNSAAAIHFTSMTEYSQACYFGLKWKRNFIIPNGINEEIAGRPSKPFVFSEIQDVVHEAPILLFLGRLHSQKGLDRLVGALREVPEAYLVIAGNDEENYWPILKDLAKKEGVYGRIMWLGPVYGPGKKALLERADLFVLPSHSENFGNAVLEAMSAGCPVVVTPEVGLSDTVSKTGVGLVVEGNAETLGKAIKNLLADKASLNRMKELGPQIAQKYFRWSSIAKTFEEKYEQLIKTSGGETL